uniref:Glutaredoxin domain-containing protein n=1 Tax=Skeletonema marinoi TaxID=267567 RepID=A0A7S2PUZ7_9STRA
MSSSIVDIKNDTEAKAASLLDASALSGQKNVLFFYAEWHEPSAAGGPFDMVVKALAGQSGTDGVNIYRVLAEEAPTLSQKYNVTTVPTFIFLNSDGAAIERIDGGEDVARVTQCYSRLASSASTTTTTSSTQPSPTQQPEEQSEEKEEEEQTLNNRLQSLITSSPIMLFLKGTPNAPKCGFSRQAIEMLTESNLTFGYFNILEDDEVRQGLKSYSDWPTFPQFYVKGELVGGLDIMKELMEEDGGLVSQLELEDYVIGTSSSSSSAVVEQTEDTTTSTTTVLSINDKLQQLINQHRIMLFMKGIPSSPKCGFSRQIVEILDSHHVSYDAFNILEDEEVRQGLKEYSDWPTYPQLYVEGDLVGGLDIVKEMEEGGDLKDLLTGDMTD